MLRGFRWLLAPIFVAGLVLALRFFILSKTMAVTLQVHCGYWAVLSTVTWFGWTVWKQRDRWLRINLGTRREVIIDGALLLGLAILLHVHEPHIFRVLYDEPSHVAGSLLMHRERLVFMPASGHYIFGSLAFMQNFPSFRLYLFQVLLSIVHDATGYRPENVFILNGILTILLIGLLYIVGRIIAGRRGGLLAVFLLVGLPLLAQNVTSGGYDILNLVLLLGMFLATRNYLKTTGSDGMDLMLATTLMLAIARYESIIYLIVPVAAAGLKWRREREITLTWMALISPIFVMPNLVANLIMVSTDVFMLAHVRQGKVDFFNIHYLIPHLKEAVYYFFAWTNTATNSVLLSAVGVVSACALLVSVASRSIRRDLPVRLEDGLLASVLVVTASLYMLALSNFWGMPTDVLAARFCLPIQMIFALSAAWFFRELQPSRVIPLWAPAIAALYIWWFTLPVSTKHIATNTMSTGRNAKWFIDYAKDHDQGRTLYVFQSDIPLLIYGFPAIQINVLNSAPEKAAQAIQAKIYDEILIHEVVGVNPLDGTSYANFSAPLDKNIVVDLVAEQRFMPDQISRIWRFKGIRQKDGTITTPADMPPLKIGFKSQGEYAAYLYSLLP